MMQSQLEYVQSFTNDLKNLRDSVLRLERQIDRIRGNENCSHENVSKLNMMYSMIQDLNREISISQLLREDILCSIKGSHLRVQMR